MVGVAPTSLPSLGGTILVTPITTIPLTIPAAGLTVQFNPSLNLNLCSSSFYLQVLQADPGAPQGVSMTPGLQMDPGF